MDPTPTNLSVLDLFSLNGQNALITGASRGIGAACALALAQAGASLCLVLRTPPPTPSISPVHPSSTTSTDQNPDFNLESDIPIVQSIRLSVPNAQICVIYADLGDTASVKGILPKALAALKVLTRYENASVDILVNCAGIQRRAPAEVFPEDDWDQVPVHLLLFKSAHLHFHRGLFS
ncbi:hypothetical protein D9613_009912 [Agrocybe pediades]|uniref:Uncharacterized protein n=1 Tax=Agrocybe pediades TaxID=84607 RepID=A0A8H4VQL2_9AGAR|nr:hypothetical protein D9613_009912 [Agrocybe pediades]